MAATPARSRARARVFSLIQLVAVTALLVISWPTSLGGQISYVQVSGKSMYPTYESGDLVVTREQPSYLVGEAVVYRVPKGDIAAGAQVVHRIIGGNGRDGFILQGDNNDHRDVWEPRHDDVVGRVAVHVPNAGTWVAYLTRPINLGILCGSLTIASMLWPRAGGADRRGDGDRRNAGDRRALVGRRKADAAHDVGVDLPQQRTGAEIPLRHAELHIESVVD